MLSVSPAAGLAANPGDTHNLTWTFNSTPQAFDYLAAGQSLVLTYTVRSTDSSTPTPGSDTQTVTITITGSNDAPDIHLVTSGTADSAAATLAESNAALSTSGTLRADERGVGDAVSSRVSAVLLDGTTGGLTSGDVMGMLSVAPLSGLAGDRGGTQNLT